jgi:hypothetical protein
MAFVISTFKTEHKSHIWKGLDAKRKFQVYCIWSGVRKFSIFCDCSFDKCVPWGQVTIQVCSCDDSWS